MIRQTTPFLYLLARTCSAPSSEGLHPVTAGRGSAVVRDLELACALYGGPAGGSRFLIPERIKRYWWPGMGFLPWPAAGNWERRGMRFTGIRTALLSRPPFWSWACPRKRRRRICRNFPTLRITREAAEKFSGEEPWRTGAAERTPSACPRSLCLADCRKTDLPDRRERKRSGSWRPPGTRHAGGPLSSGGFPGGLEEPKVYESRLHVTLDGITGSRAVTGQGALTREMAAEEAARCIQCQCLSASRAVSTCRNFKRNPRGAIPGDLQ